VHDASNPPGTTVTSEASRTRVTGIDPLLRESLFLISITIGNSVCDPAFAGLEHRTSDTIAAVQLVLTSPKLAIKPAGAGQAAFLIAG